MSVEDFSRISGLNYDELALISETSVLDQTSSLYKMIESEVGQLIAAQKTKDDLRRGAGEKRRVYIPFSVDASRVYELASDYPEWDVVFTDAEVVSAPLARAVFALTIEKLFDFTRGKKSKVVVYGTTLNSLVLRNRHWGHVCMPMARIDTYVDAVNDHRSMCAIMSATERRGTPLPMASRYREQNFSGMACSDPVRCSVKATYLVLSLHKTSTTFRQVCFMMNQHSTAVCYFALPWCKNMETNTTGPFPAIDAHVVAHFDSFDLCYKNAQDLDVHWNHAAYLELVSRTEIRLGGYSFYKENIMVLNGVAIYRVSKAEARFADMPPVYRSWVTPEYRSLYSVRTYVLKHPMSDPTRTSSYIPKVFDVDSRKVDRMISSALSLDAADFTPASVRRKLRTLTSNYVLSQTIVSNDDDVEIGDFNHLAMQVYVTCFMERYISGVTVKKLTGDSRELMSLHQLGSVGLLSFLVIKAAHNFWNSTFGAVGDAIRRLWYSLKDNIPSGEIEPAVGFRKYDQRSPNPWITMSETLFGRNPYSGFNPFLPGAFHASYLISRGVTPMVSGVSDILTFADQRRLEEDLADAIGDDTTAVDSAIVPFGESRFIEQQLVRRQVVESDSVGKLADLVTRDNGGLVDTRDETLAELVPLEPRELPPVVHAGLSESFVADLAHCLVAFFQRSALMDTSDFQSDVLYGPMEISAVANRVKFDISKLEPGKPEFVFSPTLRSHVPPDHKNNFPDTVFTVVKRNLNTPDSSTPTGVMEVWDKVWPAMLKVYYLPDTEKYLESLAYIGPTKESVESWASKIEEAARTRLVKDGEFSFSDMDMTKTDMMLKGKAKPVMDGSYDTVLKAGQSISFDSTRRSVAVLSPLISDKVMRERTILKPNVLIMQRKSPSDVNEFLNRFDHREGVSGKRMYLEFDFSMFDKAQGLMACSMHWKTLEKFKVLPEYLEFMRNNARYRTTSSPKAGVSLSTAIMRGTGDYDTLDANTDVSKSVLAEFLASIDSMIEFIMIMGDDVTVALRGNPDLREVEERVMRFFNLSVKYTYTPYGYFCSGYIAHLPHGQSRWVSDPVKRLLSYTSQSTKESAVFEEQYVSLCDLLQGIEDYDVQEYLASAIPFRMKDVCPGVSPATVRECCKAHATVVNSLENYRKLFASVRKKRVV